MSSSNDAIFDLFPELINLAGRQRMLSQRIGFFLLKFKLSSFQQQPCDKLDVEQLDVALSAFETTYRILQSGIFQQGSHQITFPTVDAMLSPKSRSGIDRFIKANKQILSAIAADQPLDPDRMQWLIAKTPGIILKSQQEAVDALQDEFSRRSKQHAMHLSSSVEEAQGAIQRIEKAAHYSKLVSLNARVAAGRAGAHGAEFSALSTELKSVADTIQHAADDVRLYLRKIA